MTAVRTADDWLEIVEQHREAIVNVERSISKLRTATDIWTSVGEAISKLAPDEPTEKALGMALRAPEVRDSYQLMGEVVSAIREKRRLTNLIANSPLAHLIE